VRDAGLRSSAADKTLPMLAGGTGLIARAIRPV